MRHGTTRGPELSGHRYRLPELPASYSGETDSVQRLFAFAYVQSRKALREAEEERRKDADCLSAVLATQQRIAAAHLDLEQCLELILEQACCITGAGGAAIALREGEDFICRGRSGLLAPDIGTRVDPESGISGECLRSAEIRQCDDTETDPRVLLPVCRALGIRSVLAVPVRGEDVAGILEVFSGWAGVFGERDVRTLEMLAGLVVVQLPKASAGAAETEHAQPAQVPVERAAELPASETREASQAWSSRLKILILALAALTAASEAVIGHGRHVQGALRISRSFFSARTPLSITPPIAPTVAPHAASRLPGTVKKAIPENRSSPVPVAGPARVLSIRPESRPDSTSVVVFLSAPTRWTSRVLTVPERIYFDLEDARLPAEMPEGSKEGSLIQVKDGLVNQIRVGMKDPGTVRIALDLAVAAGEHSAELLRQPYRLMITVRSKEGPKSAPASPPAKTQASTDGFPDSPTTAQPAAAAVDLHFLFAGLESVVQLKPANREPLPIALSKDAVVEIPATLPARRAIDATVSATSLRVPKGARKAYENGRCALQEHDLAKAQAALERAIHLYPQFAVAWTELGWLYAQQNFLDRARTAFAEARSLDSNLVPAYVGLAFVAIRESKWPEAVELSERAARLNGVGFPVALYYNSLSNLYLNKLEDAEQSARKAERLDLHHAWPQVRLLLGIILVRKQDLSGAVDEFKSYLRAAPTATNADRVRQQLAQLEQLQTLDSKPARASSHK
jgi:tetratricopeptide (TPR) repeat protein